MAMTLRQTCIDGRADASECFARHRRRRRL